MLNHNTLTVVGVVNNALQYFEEVVTLEKVTAL